MVDVMCHIVCHWSRVFDCFRFLVSFIQKDRQCESLVEKLCHRFRATRCSFISIGTVTAVMVKSSITTLSSGVSVHL